MSKTNALDNALNALIDEEIVKMEREISRRVLSRLGQIMHSTMARPDDNTWDYEMATQPVPRDTVTRLVYLQMQERVKQRRARCKLV